MVIEIPRSRSISIQSETALARPRFAFTARQASIARLKRVGEVRLFVEGQGCYDVRCMNDEWLRIWVGAGDLIAVPARRYHRFMASKAGAIRYLQPYGGRHLLMQLYRVSDDRTRAM